TRCVFRAPRRSFAHHTDRQRRARHLDPYLRLGEYQEAGANHQRSNGGQESYCYRGGNELMKRQIVILFVWAVAVVIMTHNCLGQARAGGQAPGQNYFTDVELLNQDGKKVRFYSDVLKGKTVVVNAFFTTCTSVCPPMNRNMEKIQEVLGDRIGRDVFLVSMTVDPE